MRSCDIASVIWNGYCADDIPTTSELFAAADQFLFKRELYNKLLRPLLPEKTNNSNN